MPMSDYMRKLRAKVGNQLLAVPSASIVVIDGRGYVLLVKHSDTGDWVTPGGAIEPNEIPADAAVREAWEETGLHVELQGVVGVFGGPEYKVRYRNGDETSYTTIVFLAREIGGVLAPDYEETLEARYFSPAELAQLRLPPFVREVLSSAFSHHSEGGGEPVFRPNTWVPPQT